VVVLLLLVAGNEIPRRVTWLSRLNVRVGLSSFAVAMATVKQVERNYGPAPQSLLLRTLVGGAVANLANALIIMAFYQWLVG
jgi:sodium--glutamate symport carrier gltS